MNAWPQSALLLMTVLSAASSNYIHSGNNTSTKWAVSNEANLDYQINLEFLSSESCRLRSKKYISNGLCTSPKPISEVVCAETCMMPASTRSPYTFHLNSLRRRRSSNQRNQLQKLIKWRCTEASVRKKRVKLLCHDGTLRGYGLRLITSCQCIPVSQKKS